MKLYITPWNFTSLITQIHSNYLTIFRIFWKFRELCEFFKQFEQLTQLNLVSTRYHIPRMQDALLLPLIAPYIHEKRLNGSLYHYCIKTSVWAFKRFINLSSENILLLIPWIWFITSIYADSSRFYSLCDTLYLKALKSHIRSKYGFSVSSI